MVTRARGSTLPYYVYGVIPNTSAFVGVSSDGASTTKNAFGVKPSGTGPLNLTPATALPPDDITHRGQDANALYLNTGGNLVLSPGVGSGGNVSGNVVVKDTAGNAGWNTSHIVIGIYHLWVDSTGRLRIKNSAPTSDTDGTVVGTQA